MNEHQPQPHIEAPEQGGERHKTLAVRLDEDMHAQLRFLGKPALGATVDAPAIKASDSRRSRKPAGE